MSFADNKRLDFPDDIGNFVFVVRYDPDFKRLAQIQAENAHYRLCVDNISVCGYVYVTGAGADRIHKILDLLHRRQPYYYISHFCSSSFYQ